MGRYNIFFFLIFSLLLYPVFVDGQVNVELSKDSLYFLLQKGNDLWENEEREKSINLHQIIIDKLIKDNQIPRAFELGIELGNKYRVIKKYKQSIDVFKKMILLGETLEKKDSLIAIAPVSYTHLTLPTICSV